MDTVCLIPGFPLKNLYLGSKAVTNKQRVDPAEDALLVLLAFVLCFRASPGYLNSYSDVYVAFQRPFSLRTKISHYNQRT
jgi:hypothetical protein